VRSAGALAAPSDSYYTGCVIQPPLDFTQPAPEKLLLWIPDESPAPAPEKLSAPYVGADDDLPAIFFHKP